ncbi:SCO family protein [Nocardiopsis suaedae]|uniref:SCO family protein n=1 Tax=Nocardiopsis suaedae TaxID=3018444 RepID=A0ABT4TVB7_9ACTN|nr:SCO family protein [Nocardiopsis suaedae]MDA2808652.1 SCO family protein [Nocardiopsis suaedae]
MRRMTMAAAGAAAGAALLAGCGGQAATGSGDSPYNGSEIEGAFTLPSTEFTDNKGEPYDLKEDSAGKYTAVFMGFTNCPDICPTTMADLSQAKGMLDESTQKEFQTVFITADPERDDPELLDMWLGSFDPSFVGLTTNLEDTDATADELGISVSRPEDRSGDYQVDHGGQTLLFDPEGESQVMWSYGTEPEKVAEDLETVIGEGA